MEKSYIDRLAHDYLEGLTDIEQEKVLKREILEHDKGALYPELYELFRYLEMDREDVISHCTEHKSLTVRKPFKTGRVRIYWMAALSAAASVVLFVMLHAGVFSGNSGDFELIIGGDRVDDRELALEIAENSLAKLSLAADKINESKDALGGMRKAAGNAVENIKLDLQ